MIYEKLSMDENSVLIPFSAEKRTGRDELSELINEILKEYSAENK